MQCTEMTSKARTHKNLMTNSATVGFFPYFQCICHPQSSSLSTNNCREEGGSHLLPTNATDSARGRSKFPSLNSLFNHLEIHSYIHPASEGADMKMSKNFLYLSGYPNKRRIQPSKNTSSLNNIQGHLNTIYSLIQILEIKFITSILKEGQDEGIKPKNIPHLQQNLQSNQLV